MLRPLLAGLLALSASAALADDPAHCADLAETGAKVMEARQAGVAIQDLLALTRGDRSEATLNWLIQQAYEEPVYPAGQHAAAIAMFAEGVEAACLAG